MTIPPMPTLVSPSGVSDPRALIEWGKEGWEERERCFEAWKRTELLLQGAVSLGAERTSQRDEAQREAAILRAQRDDLLAALKALVKHGNWEWHMRRDECTPEAGEAVKASLAAIAKAESR